MLELLSIIDLKREQREITREISKLNTKVDNWKKIRNNQKRKHNVETIKQRMRDSVA